MNNQRNGDNGGNDDRHTLRGSADDPLPGQQPPQSRQSVFLALFCGIYFFGPVFSFKSRKAF